MAEEEKKTSVYLTYSEEEKKELEALNAGYRDFLSRCKTERESVQEAVHQAEAAGYRDLAGLIEGGERLQPGDKVYAVNMKKAIVLFQIGEAPLADGMNILGAHIDTCSLDVKQNPLYEDGGLAYLDTHYGTVVDICIGESEDDPVFCVTDLLIHLSQEQMKKTGAKVVEGEDLDILVGNYPLKKEDKESVKAGVLALIEQKYGFAEEDFQSAELRLVPAGKARELGFDRSMTLAYGQDDRVCAYTSLRAMLENTSTRRTSCCLLVDKEEIGSVGATGMQSRFFENTVAELMRLVTGTESDLALRRCLANCKMLSSDVSSYLGRGMVFNKFTGARGKSGSNDANAEYLGELRRILEAKGVRYQLAELGKVDLGGGGTIAYIMSLYGMQVVDSGVGVLSMHAPWEATSKVDVYETKKGYMAFLALA